MQADGRELERVQVGQVRQVRCEVILCCDASQGAHCHHERALSCRMVTESSWGGWACAKGLGENCMRLQSKSATEEAFKV